MKKSHQIAGVIALGASGIFATIAQDVLPKEQVTILPSGGAERVYEFEIGEEGGSFRYREAWTSYTITCGVLSQYWCDRLKNNPDLNTVSTQIPGRQISFSDFTSS